MKGGNLKAKITARDTVFMVLSEVWFPERKVFIDGRETPVYVTNYVLMGIKVPKGEHVLELKYVPDSFRKGLMFTLLGLLISIVMIFISQEKFPLFGGPEGKR